MPNSSGERVGQQLDGRLLPQFVLSSFPPPSETAASAPQPLAVDSTTNPRTARQWASDPQRRRPQKRKPPSDRSVWRGRDDDADKTINNHRKILRCEWNKALAKHDALTVESARADADAACVNLERQYRRLYFLDKLNIVIKTCKWGGEEQQINMSDEQIQRNLDL